MIWVVTDHRNNRNFSDVYE
ncbi:unnamed protein product, partial [Vitis vinifera]